MEIRRMLSVLISIGALLALCGGTAAAAADKDQQKCINALNKDGAKVADAQEKLNRSCIKDAGKGKLLLGQSADDCLTADDKQKVAKKKDKTQSDFDAKCAASFPAFGVPSGSTVATVNAAAMDHSVGLLRDIFGADLDSAVVDCDDDRDSCKCQQAVSKGYGKLSATKTKEFVKCKKNALRVGKEPFPGGATSSSDLEACVDDGGTAGSIANDEKEKISKRLTKLGDAIQRKCTDPGVNTFRAFPGVCAGLSGTPLRNCIDQRVECRVCLTINAMDDLNVDCDTFDDTLQNGSCPPVVAETTDIPSGAEPPNTPGTFGVSVDNPNLETQFGSSSFSLNNARYTRFHFSGPPEPTPDAILILVPGFEGGANDFKILAENLLPKALRDAGITVEVWAYDRRTNQLEDTLGLDIAESLGSAQVGLDWLFGGELGLTLDPNLPRRAFFHNAQEDVAFIANWTSLVFSRDIDAIVEAARAEAKNANVFLGGHSAGTGFTARYAGTDFNLSGIGPADPGYAKLRGLVLLEGGGGSAGAAPSSDTLDRIEAKFDGGLFGAVRDNAPRCVDGTTPCTIDTENVDCGAFANPKCTLPTSAYSIIPGLLNPRVLAAVEPSAIQALTDPDSGQIILQVDQGAPGNTAVMQVPDLAALALLPQATVQGGIGSFIDDDGFIAAFASFVATSVGATGPVVGGLTTWLDITEVIPPSALPDHGPPPVALPAAVWGQEKEVTDFNRMLTTFFAGGSNFTDWYYPNSGLSTTSVSGVCSAGFCSVGDVGAACTADGDCSQSLGLDSSALSIGRSRPDIENLTQASAINIPVIGFGGSNGLVRVPGNFVGFAQSIGMCTAASCTGSTARVVDAANPNPAFPTFGEVDGGFEVYISEGFAHVDVLTAEDDANNNVLGPLVDFLDRNIAP